MMFYLNFYKNLLSLTKWNRCQSIFCLDKTILLDSWRRSDMKRRRIITLFSMILLGIILFLSCYKRPKEMSLKISFM